MPTTYSIDPDRHLVRMHAWGHLTEAETRALYNRLQAEAWLQLGDGIAAPAEPLTAQSAA